MRLVKTFSRRLKTARRFVFENIMDLDHVCVLHKRWFRHLRIRVWRPDYVAYRLRSNFYGLRQDIEVRGAPIDENRYWYEFRGRLARIRVEGLMEGPDGDLTLTETITYHFPWALAPLFWALGPLFVRQKRDILSDDGRLLETSYALEQAGFKRSDAPGVAPKVVVYGGNGFFGRLVVWELLQHSDATIVIASRTAHFIDFGKYANRVKFYISDMNDLESVLSVLEGARVLVSCVGPCQGMALTLLRGCIEKRVHYVDVADDRDFFQRAYALKPEIEAAGIMAFLGCSVVPGMSALLTRFCLEKRGRADRVRIIITPGTRFARGPGSFECLLSTVGEEYSVPWQGDERKIRGWTGRQEADFPPPLGIRGVYSVVDIADYFTQPLYFGAKSVEFKIGSELDLLNRGLAAFRLAREWLGIRNARRFIPFFRKVIGAARLFGSSQGALMVEVTDSGTTPERTMSICVFREENGETIPAILPGVATRMILDGELCFSGIASLPDWISFTRFASELGARGVRMATKLEADDGWTPWPGAGNGLAEMPPSTLGVTL